MPGGVRVAPVPTVRRAPAPRTPPVPDTTTAIHYPVAADFRDRMQVMERTIRDRLLANPSSKIWQAQLMIIECLKGRCKVTDLFSWTSVR